MISLYDRTLTKESSPLVKYAFYRGEVGSDRAGVGVTRMIMFAFIHVRSGASQDIILSMDGKSVECELPVHACLYRPFYIV